MATKTHYEILSVPFDANTATIRKAYRKLAQLYHPDKHKNKISAERKFKALNDAYNVLSDKAKRSAYDLEHGIISGKRSSVKCVYVEGSRDIENPDCYRNGKRHGKWEMHYNGEQVEKGRFVDGKKHGKWEEWLLSNVLKGPYVKDKRHGKWEIRLDNGDVFKGPFVKDKQHGQWEERWADGDVWKGPYLKGKQHGQWEELWANGTVRKGPYVNDKKHGQWEERWMFSQVDTDSDVEGKEQKIAGDSRGNQTDKGQYMEKVRDTTLEQMDAEQISLYLGEGIRDEQEENDQQAQNGADGDVWKGPYVDNQRHGLWEILQADGTVGRGPMVNGWQNGEWWYHWYDGGGEILIFVDGGETKRKKM